MISSKLTVLSETRSLLLRTDRRKSSLKGGWLKMGYSQEGRNKPKYPKHRISSQVALLFAAIPIELVRRSSPNWTFDHRMYWIPRSCFWHETEVGEVTPTEGIMLSPREEHMAKTLGGTGDQLTPGVHRMKPEGIFIARPTLLPTWHEFTMFAYGSRGFLI